MSTITEEYGGHQLIARQIGGSWRVQVGETGQSTMTFLDSEEALREARRIVDAQFSRTQR